MTFPPTFSSNSPVATAFGFAAAACISPNPERTGRAYPIWLRSDWVEFTIGEGKAAPVVDIVRRLHPILPEGWSIATGSSEDAITVRLCRNSGAKGDEIGLQLGGRPDSGFTRLGDGPWGAVWLKDRHPIEDPPHAARGPHPPLTQRFTWNKA